MCPRNVTLLAAEKTSSSIILQTAETDYTSQLYLHFIENLTIWENSSQNVLPVQID